MILVVKFRTHFSIFGNQLHVLCVEIIHVLFVKLKLKQLYLTIAKTQRNGSKCLMIVSFVAFLLNWAQ